MSPKGDIRNDLRCGFEIVTARDIDRIGVQGVIKKLKERVRDSNVYISVDIDVLDPAYAPGKPRGNTSEPLFYSQPCMCFRQQYARDRSKIDGQHVITTECRSTARLSIQSLFHQATSKQSAGLQHHARFLYVS